MASLEISNRSPQGLSVVVKQEGKRRLVHLSENSVVYLVDAEPTPELEAVHRSKKLNISYRVRE